MTTYSSLQPKGQMPNKPQYTRMPPKASRRRDKPQVSCSLCRKRKLKCDRGQPCENCLRRGHSCTYSASSNPSRRLDREHLRPEPPISTSLHDRIRELERLVKSQIKNSHAIKPVTSELLSETKSSPDLSLPANEPAKSNFVPTQNPQLSDNLGWMSLENAETSYVESAHWRAILDKIVELRDHFEDGSTPTGPLARETQVPEFEGPELLFGGYKTVEKRDILAAMPPRPLVDRLVVKCFNSVDIAPVIIHRPTFFREYEKFWENPPETPVMWIGLLFATMCAATLYEQFSPNESAAIFHQESTPDPKHLILRYREKIIQCLILGNYTKCSPYTIEALLLYLHAESVRSEDTQIGNWVLLGIIIRLALRMGYHIDASYFPRVTVFEVEMRRRTWMVIFMLDVFTSAQVGLPRMIKDSQGDTAPPKNLMDEDLHKNMKELPIDRLDTVQTPVQFFAAKNRIVHVFGRIIDLTTTAPPCSYEDIMALDKVLHDTYKAIPQWLAMRSITQSIMDAPELTVRRIYVDLLFNKARCILHRKYMLEARTNINFMYSRTVCIEAALRILEIQRDMGEEMQIGGRLYEDRWKVSSIVKHEFLLATTILCFDLNHDMNVKMSSEDSKSSLGVAARENVVKALSDSYSVWLRASGSSKEARKAVEVLRIVLGKAQRLSTANSQNMEEATAGEYGESILQRPEPINFMVTSRRSRGMQILPPMDEGRWGDGDLAAALEMNGEPGDLNTERSGYQMPGWEDILGRSNNFPQHFYSSLDGTEGE